MFETINWPMTATWAGVITAVLAAVLQIRAATRVARVERVISVHRELTSDEVGAARIRLSSHLWRQGEERNGRRICRPLRIDEVDPPLRGDPPRTLSPILGAYPNYEPHNDMDGPRPGTDFYRILWCFQRMEESLKSGALDEGMFERLMAPHIVWWDHATRHVSPSETWFITSLRSLAARVRTSELERWVQTDFGDS